MGGERLGRYRILKHIASGGMADVLLARTEGIEGFERHVVVKRIRAEHAKDQRFINMFLDEARVASSLHHQNIVQVNDIGEVDGEYFIAMEYLHGPDLRKVLSAVSKSKTHMPLGYVIAIISAAAAGLNYAHERRGSDQKPLNIVHRDVSPSNILVGYDGFVKVVDFGIAKAAMRQAETKSGSLKGKVSYMSPEQCRGDELDRRSDVYALGIVLYELATTSRLFKGDNEYMLMDAIVHGRVTAPRKKRPDLPSDLEEIILRAIAMDREKRYQSCEELRIALEQFAARGGLTASGSALATYMQKLFGTPIEPWLEIETSTNLTSQVPTAPARMSWTEVPRDGQTSVLEGGGAEETSGTSAPTTTDGKRRAASSPSPEPAIGGHETHTSGKYGFEQKDRLAPRVSTAKLAAIALPVLAAAGLATWYFGLREEAPKSLPAASAPAEAPAAPTKVAVTLDANVPGARVVFRRRVAAAPHDLELAPSDIVELIEVSAPGHKSTRYWLTFDRPTKFRAHLSPGTGVEDATEEQTLVALGELEAPAPAAPPEAAPLAERPVVVATAKPAAPPPRRKIGPAATPQRSEPAPEPEPVTEAPVTKPALPAPAPPAPTPPTPTPAPAPAVAAAPRNVPPSELRKLLIASPAIDVPKVVQSQARRDGNSKLSAVVKVCVNTRGEVTATSLMKSSGYAPYDERLLAGMKAWRYKPYVVDGKPIGACSAVASAFVLP